MNIDQARPASLIQNRRERKIRNRSVDRFWNCLNVLLLAGTVVVLVIFGIIFQNPNSIINPFPPPTQVAAVSFPTFPPTETPEAEPTAEPTATESPVELLTPTQPAETPTVTPEPTATPTEGPTATETVYYLYPFILRDEVVAIAGSTFPDHEECRLWVAGRTYNKQGAPMVGITVQLGGFLGKSVSQYSLTGTALQYGPSGYEFMVSDIVQSSNEQLWVQLLDQSGVPLTSRVSFDTYEDCGKNLILINFKQVR